MNTIELLKALADFEKIKVVVRVDGYLYEIGDIHAEVTNLGLVATIEITNQIIV